MDAPRRDCWVCYDNERTDAGPMILPCLCKGDVAAVHHDCLKRWLIEVRKYFCSTFRSQHMLHSQHMLIICRKVIDRTFKNVKKRNIMLQFWGDIRFTGTNSNLSLIERFHSRDQRLYWYTKTKENVCIKIIWLGTPRPGSHLEQFCTFLSDFNLFKCLTWQRQVRPTPLSVKRIGQANKTFKTAPSSDWSALHVQFVDLYN